MPFQIAQKLLFIFIWLVVGMLIMEFLSFSTVRLSENFQSALLFTANNPTSYSSQSSFSHFYSLFLRCYRLRKQETGICVRDD